MTTNKFRFKFRTGNVVKDPGGSLVIVIGVEDARIHWVSFDAENVGGISRRDDYEDERMCLCGDHPDFQGEPQEGCESCAGTGRYIVTVKGFNKHAKVLAPNVKAFIQAKLDHIFYPD